MRTPRRHRLSRRQSEQLLDGLDGPDDLVRLLEPARRPPVSGELPGESAALAAFRTSAPASAESHPRSLPVRTLSLSRGLVIKALATTAAALTVGGVALAATGHLPAPKLPSQAAAAHPTAAHPTAAHPTAEDPSAHPATGQSTTDGGGDTPAVDAPASPTGSPGSAAGTPAADRGGPSTGAPAARASGGPQRHREAARYIGVCRAWSESTKPASGALTRSTAFRELASSAGGVDKVTAYCGDLQQQWCSDHRWPLTASAHYSGRPYPIRCVPPRPTGLPSRSPSGPPRSMPPAPTRPSILPSKQPSIVRPTVMPNGGPARN